MNPLFTIMPLLIISAAVTYGIFRALGRVWLEHRVRLALLEKVQEKPELMESYRELQAILVGLTEGSRPEKRQNYTLTGAILALIGLACTLIGRDLGVGRLAVGVYIGGMTCICLGIVLAFMGLLIRLMSRTALPLGDD